MSVFTLSISLFSLFPNLSLFSLPSPPLHPHRQRQAEDGGTQGAEPVGGRKGRPRAAVVGDGGEGRPGARWAASSKLMLAWLRAGGWRNLAQSRRTVWEPHEPVSAIARSRASSSSSFYRAAPSRAPPPRHHRRNRHRLLVVMDRAITARHCPPHVPMLHCPSLVPALRPPVFPRPSPHATAHRLYATTCPSACTRERESNREERNRGPILPPCRSRHRSPSCARRRSRHHLPSAPTDARRRPVLILAVLPPLAQLLMSKFQRQQHTQIEVTCGPYIFFC